MSAIKPGDLVIVVKPTPCCADDRGLSKIFSAKEGLTNIWKCKLCGHISSIPVHMVSIGELGFIQVSRLKKIDPPATGDSLPTRADIGVAA